MTTPVSLDSFVWLVLASDTDTPPELLPEVGKVVGLAPDVVASLGSGASSPGVLFANTAKPIRGYHRVGGSTGHEWVMIASITPAIRNSIEAIPGGLGWINQVGGGPRSVYRQLARTLILLDVPGPDVVDILTRAYNAAVANRVDQIAAGG